MTNEKAPDTGQGVEGLMPQEGNEMMETVAQRPQDADDDLAEAVFLACGGLSALVTDAFQAAVDAGVSPDDVFRVAMRHAALGRG